MVDAHAVDSYAASAPETGLDRLIRRVGLGLVAWSQRREMGRARRIAARADDVKLAGGIFDPDAPRAVRRFGFPPGIFR